MAFSLFPLALVTHALVQAPPFLAVQLLQVLGTLLLLTAFATVAARLLPQAIQIYALQSLVLALIAVVVGYFTGSIDLYLVAVLTLLVKCGVVTWILRRASSRLPVQREVRPYLAIPASLLVCALLTLLAFFTSPAIAHAPVPLLRQPLLVTVKVAFSTRKRYRLPLNGRSIDPSLPSLAA